MAERESVLEKVRKLLDKADSTTFDAERDALIAKADALMITHAIEMHEIEENRSEANRAEEIILNKVRFGTTPIQSALVEMADNVAIHTRCRIVIYGSGTAVGFVGFEGDAKYAEMLTTSLWMQMTAALEPKPDPELSIEENIIMLLQSGQNRRRVCELIGWEYEKDHGKVSKIWRAHKEALGEEYTPRSRTHPISYARNFAMAFAEEIGHRLFEIRERRGDYDRKEGDSVAIVLKDRRAQVSDAFDEMFPKLGTYRDRMQGRFDASAQRRGAQAGKTADLSQKSVSGRNRALGGP